MAYTNLELRKIYDRTTGYCHLCWKKLSFTNYGILNSKGAWEVEHSNPKSMGGTDRINNLYAAHISCNRSKNNKSTRTARAKYGHTCAPLSREKRKELEESNTTGWALIGLLLLGFAIIKRKNEYDRNHLNNI